MAGIWGDGQRGGIFGAKVNPLLVAELERRAVEKRQMAQGLEAAGKAQSTIGSRAQDWWNNTTFFKPAYDELMGGLTAPGDVMSGEQPTMAADPQTGEFHTAPELMDRAGALAGTMTLGAGAIPAEANALRMGIKAYHGSPHDFERFDSSKIGTGEGAQAYGHGMYFAEAEPVAKQYRDNLAGYKFVQDALASGKDKRPAQVAEWLYADPNMTDEHIGQALKVLEENAPASQVRQWTEEGRKLLATSKDAGRMYEVDIAADPEHFLDWDRPLAEQDRTRLGVPEQYKTVRSAMDYLGEQQVKPSSGSTFNAGEQRSANAAAASALRERGVPGIRYLDQGSRPNVGRVEMLQQQLATLEARNASPAAIENTRRELAEAEKTVSRNYVVFPGNEDLISILKKYGLPISAAGLAALSQLHPEEAQAAQKKQKGR